VVNCRTQQEVDRLWATLVADGGEEGQCGWLKDKFGLSWQIVPTVIVELLGDKDPAKAGRVMQAMLPMKKIDIAGLKKVYAQS
jgi:predicted 3-demethylubiquinone-9 3-methyltransferase (glyoxalase superfamily)